MHRIAAVWLVVALAGTSARADTAADRWFASDKAAHFAVTTGLGAGGYGVGAVLFERREARLATGLTVALGAGAAKEWRDQSRGGRASWRDFTWDAVGAVTGVTLAWLVDRARHGRRTPQARPAPGPR